MSQTLPCVAIIDDDADFLEFLTTFVNRLGYRVKTFCGRSRLECVSAVFEADLLLTDLYMPDLDGLEILRLAGRIETPPPIIVMTGCEPALCDMFDHLTAAFSAKSLIRKTDIPEHLPALLARVLN